MEESGLLRAKFHDVDDFNETVRGWNLQFRQIDRGELDVKLAQYQTPNSNIVSTQVNRVMRQSGASPYGMRTFGIRKDSLPWMQWCGREVNSDSLLCFHPSNDYESLTLGGFNVFALSFETAHLTAIASRLGYPDFLDRLSVDQAVDGIDTGRLNELRALLHTSFSNEFVASDTANYADARDRLDNRVAEELVMLLTDPGLNPVRETLARRSRAVNVAVSYILERAHEPVSVGQICAAANVSWRTLDRAFNEFLGVNPKTCVNAVRLHGARRELQQADPTASVADIANNWGYWHLGSFAKDYRQEFNELPSQTLANQAPSNEIQRSPLNLKRRL